MPAWLHAIEQHQPGEADAAVRLVSDWTGDQLMDVVAGFEVERSGTSVETTRKLLVLKRAVLLHTDVAMLITSRAATPDVAWTNTTSSLHFGVALELVDWLRKQTRKEDAFARTWYHLVAAFLVSQYEIQSTPIFMDRATSVFRGDADLLLMAGGVHELLASPRVQEGADLQGIDKCGSADQNLMAAEHFYREALGANPSLTEARARLGRVTGQQGRHERALAELTRALKQGPSPALTYFIYLFIGEEEEALNRTGPARAAYEHAIELRPDVQFAYLALSRLERRSGNRPAGVVAMQKMLHLPHSERDQSDPWTEYYAAGLARRADDLLNQFREPFRSRQ
jgi:tetratricopeptide (TPR) repeat protein